jgi:hypothetical protein
LRQVQVDQFLKSLGYKPIAAEHDHHRGALEDRLDGDIIMYGQEEVLRGVLPMSEHNITESMKDKNKEHDLLKEFNSHEETDVNTLTDRQKEAIMHNMWVIGECLKSLWCKSITAEPDLYFVALEDRLEGVIATHVDDLYMTGTERFHRQVARSPMSECVVGVLLVMKFVLCDWKTEQEEDSSIKGDIEHAAKEISEKQVDKDPSKDKVYSTLGKLFGRRGRNYQLGRTGTLKIMSFGDAAFGNIPDKDPGKDKVYSTVGKLVCLEGEGGATSLISWSSKKASRVDKSALAAKIMAASEACDEGHWDRHILEQLPGLTLFMPSPVLGMSEVLIKLLQKLFPVFVLIPVMPHQAAFISSSSFMFQSHPIGVSIVANPH